MLISWNTTRACNLACRHCYRDAGTKQNDELDTEEARVLLEQIKKAGFRLVILSGGEPLLRKDIYELIAYAKGLDLKPVLGSNGTLIDQKSARRLKETGLARAGISLDSADSKVHDAFRGQSGSWQRSVDGMKNCRDAGLEFQMHTTITPFNCDEMEGLADLAQALGAEAYHIFFLVPVGRAKEMQEEIDKQAFDHERLLRKILDRQKSLDIQIKITCAPQFMRLADQMGLEIPYKRGCLAGISYCAVLPNGDVHPCPYLPVVVGNVRRQSFLDIWQGNEILRQLRRAELKGNCGICKYRSSCGGCRARAYFYSGGDYMAEDPWCSYQAGKANPKEESF